MRIRARKRYLIRDGEFSQWGNKESLREFVFSSAVPRDNRKSIVREFNRACHRPPSLPPPSPSLARFNSSRCVGRKCLRGNKPGNAHSRGTRRIFRERRPRFALSEGGVARNAPTVHTRYNYTVRRLTITTSAMIECTVRAGSRARRATMRELRRSKGSRIGLYSFHARRNWIDARIVAPCSLSNL